MLHEILLPPDIHPDVVADCQKLIAQEVAGKSGGPVIVKAYGTVRGGAARHITAALPAVGALVQKYAG